ncbi:MAG: peptidoglycan DD-metalloendopeptidase family protein [Micrococcaceae bacterium]
MATSSGSTRSVSSRRSAAWGVAVASVLTCTLAGAAVISAQQPAVSSPAVDESPTAEATTPQRDSFEMAPVTLASLQQDLIATMASDLSAQRLGTFTLTGGGELDQALVRTAADLAADESEDENRIAGGELDLPGGITLSHPVSSTRISSPFGMRSNPTGPGYQFHVGQDYPVPTGTPVRAAAAGTITFAGWHRTGGMRIEIDHGHGVKTAYSHNSRLAVSVGDTVSAGGLVALAGSTGNSTGPHVHFEVIVNGRWVDPRLYLPTLPNQPRALTDDESRGLYSVDGPTLVPTPGASAPSSSAPTGPSPSQQAPTSSSPSASTPGSSAPSGSSSSSPSGSSSPSTPSLTPDPSDSTTPSTPSQSPSDSGAPSPTEGSGEPSASETSEQPPSSSTPSTPNASSTPADPGPSAPGTSVTPDAPSAPVGTEGSDGA